MYWYQVLHISFYTYRIQYTARAASDHIVERGPGQCYYRRGRGRDTQRNLSAWDTNPRSTSNQRNDEPGSNIVTRSNSTSGSVSQQMNDSQHMNRMRAISLIVSLIYMTTRQNLK